MLTDIQAKEIVQGSVSKATGRQVATGSLRDAGINETELNVLIKTLVADPDSGVPRFEHYLDPNDIIGQVDSTTTIEELTGKVLKLSAGKLCSNPNTPHDQTCCPYPTTCPQCGYAIL
jgi:hypothetical protein